jgi:hypothetical protein
MKKKVFWFIYIIIAITGCSGRFYNRVIRYDDEFRNSSKRIARVNVRNDERRSEVRDAKIVFEKVEGLSGEESHSQAYFVIERSTASFGIGSQGYMKAGGRKFELRVEEPISEYKTEYETTEMNTVTSDSTGYSSFQMANTSTNNWFDEKFVTNFTPEMESSIGLSDRVIFRFYFGPIQSTFILEGRKLKAVQGVFVN